MVRRIKFNFIQSLFRIFLTNQTKTWVVLVKPKILLGSIILGLITIACISKNNTQNTPEQTDTIDIKNNGLSHTQAQILPNPNPVNNPPFYIADPKRAREIVVERAIEVEKKIDRNYIYSLVEKMPEFPGGEEKMFNFIRKNLRYSAEMLESGIQGRVICRLVIEKNGRISNVEVLKSLSPACDKEAVRVIKLMPKWIPGEQDGKKVRVNYILPVLFKEPPVVFREENNS